MEGNYISEHQLIVKQERFAQKLFEELTQREAYTQSSDEVDWRLINEVSIGRDGTFKFDNKGPLDMVVKHLGMFTDQVELSGFDELVEVTNSSEALPDSDLKLIEMMNSNRITGRIVDI